MADERHTSVPDETPGDWGPCPDGTVDRLVGKLKHRKRMQRIKQATVVAGSLLMLVVAGRFLVAPDAPPPPLTHHEVTQLADRYIRGELDEELTRRVEDHISRCKACGHLVEDRKAYQQESNSHTRLIRDEESNLLAHSH